MTHKNWGFLQYNWCKSHRLWEKWLATIVRPICMIMQIHLCIEREIHQYITYYIIHIHIIHTDTYTIMINYVSPHQQSSGVWTKYNSDGNEPAVGWTNQKYSDFTKKRGGEKDREGAKTWGVLDGHNMFLYMMSVHVSDIPKFFGAESPRSLFKMPRFPWGTCHGKPAFGQPF